jgi:uncharacterized protein YbjT (DUF2867 family)
MSKILVVGASGTVGSELSKLLKARGHTVTRASSKKNLLADQVHLNLATREGLAQAFEGVEKAFLLSPPGFTNQDELLSPVIDHAKARGLKKVVLMSAMGANASDELPMRKAELHLEKAGLTYNIIRPNWFMQNFNTFWIQGILAQGKIFLPTGKAKGSFIDARDIAAVAASLLHDDRFNNQAFDLTGAEALDHDQVARILSETTGKQIGYQEIPSEAMLQGLLQAGLPKNYAEFLIVILGYFKAGYSERTTDAVQKITGKDPIRFKQYAADYKAAWANALQA